MMSQLLKSSMARGSAVAAFALAIAVSTQSEAAKRLRPITKPKFDPSAQNVKLFDGIKNGQIDVRVIPKDSKGGRILFENKTKKPLTVHLPKAVVGVQVLKQLQPGGGGLGGGGLGQGGGGLGQGSNNNQGMQQPFGGGMMGGMGGMGMMGGMGGMGGMGMGGMGGGFFSVPPQRTVLVPYKSVCLAHGKPEPSPKATYKLVKVEEYTKDKTLQKLLEYVATGKIDDKIAQAAAWHLTDKMSWRELALKKQERLGASPTPYFSPAHIFYAQRLIAIASGKVKDETPKTQPTRRTRSRSRFTSR